jgi:hypothetical protein
VHKPGARHAALLATVVLHFQDQHLSMFGSIVWAWMTAARPLSSILGQSFGLG